MNQRNAVTTWTLRSSVAAAALAAIGLSSPALGFEFFVSANGSAQGSDREAALDEAYEKASEQARLFCAGGNGQVRHDRIDRTGSNCLSAGDGDGKTYTCMVFVRANCVSSAR
jgi:hypothetical protein